MFVSLFAVVSSAASVSGQTMAGTGPALTTSWWEGPGGGRGDFFAVDTDGTLWNMTYSDSAGPWNSLGGVCTSSPAAVSWNTSLRFDVFVRGSDGAVWQKTYNNSIWSPWHSLGGQLASGTGPAVALWSAGRLDVFAEGTNGALYHKWYANGAWSAWESLGGKLTASPAATSPLTEPPGGHVINVYVRGSDGAVWQKSYKNGWSSWHSLGGQVVAGTGPAANGGLFVQGTDHQLWQWTKSTGWHTLAGKPPEALSAASPASVLAVDYNSGVCVSSTSGNIWYTAGVDLGDNWTSVGSPP